MIKKKINSEKGEKTRTRKKLFITIVKWMKNMHHAFEI